MVLNYIWVAFFVIAFIVALCKLIFMGDVEIFTETRQLHLLLFQNSF